MTSFCRSIASAIGLASAAPSFPRFSSKFLRVLLLFLAIFCASSVFEGESCSTQVHNRFCDRQAVGQWGPWAEWAAANLPQQQQQQLQHQPQQQLQRQPRDEGSRETGWTGKGAWGSVSSPSARSLDSGWNGRSSYSSSEWSGLEEWQNERELRCNCPLRRYRVRETSEPDACPPRFNREWDYKCDHGADRSDPSDCEPVPPMPTQNLPPCGRNDWSLRSSRIIGGTDTNTRELPYQVMLTDLSGQQFCGGTLIAPRFVLTAAHCLLHLHKSNVVIVLAADLSNGSGRDAVSVEVVDWINHNNYERSQTDDVAVILLPASVEQSVYNNTKIWPACMPEETMNLATGNMSLASGWGSTEPTDREGVPITLPSVVVLDQPYPLQEVWMPLISSTDCQNMMESTPALSGFSAPISSKEICAGLQQGGKDSCQGDSGGPLVVFDADGVATIIGVTSWGYGCGYPGLPGVYARVDSYLSWINDAMNRLYWRHIADSPPTSPPPSLQRQCGENNLAAVARGGAKIIGGMAAQYGSLPYQVLILLDSSQHCGGTLIEDRIVLTAAHCVEGVAINSTTYVLGADTSDGVGSRAVTVNAVAWKYHEMWNSNTTENDVALVLLEESITDSVYTNENIWPACLPSGRMQLNTGDMAIISGWGSTQPIDIENNPIMLPNVTVLSEPYPLQQAWLPLITSARCGQKMFDSGLVGTIDINQYQICAGLDEGGKDGCQGDSGGPLVVVDDYSKEHVGTATVVGVTSWGFGCGYPGLPGVYARVDSYLQWINQTSAELRARILQ